MKKNIVINFLSVLLLCGFMTVGCNDNIPPLNVEGIPVESISLKESLVNGLKLEEGATENISLQVNLVPENATDRAETYYSSDIDVATVSMKGELTALTPGTSEITIMVGGKEVSFTLEVTEKVVIHPERIFFSVDKLDVMLGVESSVAALVRVEPGDANDDILYESSDESIVTVDADGMANGVKEGEASITIRAKRDKTGTVKATLPVTVKKFSGDYIRKAWSMKVSQDISTWSTQSEGNSLTAAIDGNYATNLCLVKPGRTQSGVTCGENENVWIMIDMGVAQVVDYFRIHHRENDMLGLRWRGFEKIEGSNDGEKFVTIVEDIKIPDWDKASQYESDTIKFNNDKAYKYIKFSTSPSRAGVDYQQYVTTTDRGSIQISEIYLGILPE